MSEAKASHLKVRRIAPGSSTSSSFLDWSAFKNARGLNFDAAGNLYISAPTSHSILRVTSIGRIAVVAGKPIETLGIGCDPAGMKDGAGTADT